MMKWLWLALAVEALLGLVAICIVAAAGVMGIQHAVDAVGVCKAIVK